MDPTDIIFVDNLRRHDRTASRALFEAVCGVTFSVRRGELFALLGTNGAGTSTLEVLEGLALPSSGTVKVLGRDPARERRVVRPRTGVMLQEGGLPAGLTVVETTRMWAGTLTAAPRCRSQAAVALRPESPERLRATAPPDPRDLREQVNADVSALLVVLAGLSLVVGALGIANSTLVAVMERVGEIGLRRAVGARPRHIAGQFLVESTALGTIGGLIGTALGSVGVVLLSLVRGWTPLMEPGLVVVAPFIGTLVGLLAGMYPAWRAARIEPVEALRR